MMPLSRHRCRLGVAIARDRVVVAAPYGDGELDRTWACDIADSEHMAEAIAAAVSDACQALHLERPRLAFAVMPPLAECRLLHLPGLREDEIARVLQRDAARYFPAAGAPLATAGARLGSAADAPVLAGAVPVGVLEAIQRAAQSTGLDVASITVAHASWLASIAALRADGASDRCAIVVMLPDRLEVIGVQHGMPTSIRRLRGATAPERIIATLGDVRRGDATGPVMVFAAPGEGGALTAVLAAHGERVVTPSGHPAGEPAIVAARFATSGGALAFVPEDVRTRQHNRAVRRQRVMVAASVLLLASAMGLELWDVERERAHVEAVRGALRPAIERVLARRDSLASMLAWLEEVHVAAAGTPRLSATLVALAARLPRDAHLLSLRADGDSLIIEAVATHAAPVIDALVAAPELRDVRAQGSVRQELRPGAPPLERFTLVIRAALADTSSARATVAPARLTAAGEVR